MLITVPLCASQTTESIQYEKQGDNITLLCTLVKEHDPVTWDFNSTQYTSNWKINPYLPQELRNRISVVGNYDLHITDIRTDDEGRYQCVANIAGRLAIHTVYFYLIKAPSSLFVPDLQKPENRTRGTEDQDLTITCTAVAGNPPPVVTLIGKGDNYIYKSGIQSISYTFSKIRRMFDLKVLECRANNFGLSSPLKQEVQIYLELKPLKPVLNREPHGIENVQPLSINCTSTGSRPPANLSWIIDQMDLTHNTIQQVTHDSLTDTYTVISALSHALNRSHHGKVLFCKAVNNILTDGILTGKTLNISFAPEVSVLNVTYIQNDSTRTVTCVANGNPPTYTYTWQHKTKYGKVIRKWDNVQDDVLTLPDIPIQNRYQDSGIYECLVSNGVTDRHGDVLQPGGIGSVVINASPVFTLFNNQTQYGELGKSTAIHINVYSIPKYTIMTWYKDNTIISSSNKYLASDIPVIVYHVFHTTMVTLDGYTVTLTINNLQNNDFTKYMVQLSNGVGGTVEYTAILEPHSAPDSPKNLTTTTASSTSITVQWILGFDGGHPQTFTVEYRKDQLDKWVQISISGENINLSTTTQSFTVTGLQPGTLYYVRMFAFNLLNQSEYTAIHTVRTMAADNYTSFGPVIGGVVGGFTALFIVLCIMVVVLIKKRRGSLISGKLITKSMRSESSEKQYKNTGIEDKPNDYEELENKYSQEHIKGEGFELVKMYETLGTKDQQNEYDELNEKGISGKNAKSLKMYESLGTKNHPNVYDELKEKEMQKQEHNHDSEQKAYESLGTKDQQNLYDDLKDKAVEEHVQDDQSKTAKLGTMYEPLRTKDPQNVYDEIKNKDIIH